jgi:hypothetical protein
MTKAKTFKGLSYRALQQQNAERRQHLDRADQAWLKQQGYRNLGWSNVIRLHEQINELLEKRQSDDLTLEELFLKADQIGQKYQTREEIAAFEQQLAAAADTIAEITDQQFPDTEPEVIDFSQGRPSQKLKKQRRL